jgi:signal peptidase I
MFQKNKAKHVKQQPKKTPKTTWQKIWYFIWDDDSVWSWLANVVIAFILIKYIVYPGLGLVFGTTHPVVAVVSGSMEHKLVHPCVTYERYPDGRLVCKAYDPNSYQICGKTFDEKKRVDLEFFYDTCGDFYGPFNITEEGFNEFPMKNGFNTGDIIVLFGSKPKNLEVGDIIVFRTAQRDPIIHRIISKREEGGKYLFRTKGDHNENSYGFESNIIEEQLVGKAVFKIPFLGNVKIWFVDLLHLLKLDTSIGRLFG